MRKALVLILLMGLGLLCRAVEVKSISSVDLSKSVNQVTVRLSEAGSYTVQKLPGGNGVRLVIPGGQNAPSPQYPRLSKVLDYISARQEGTDTVIDIRALGEFKESHAQGGDNSITISLQSNAPSAQPRQVSQARPAQSDAVQQASRPVPETPATVNESPAASTAGGEDFLFENEIPVVETLSVAGETSPRGESETPAQKKELADRKSWLVYLIPALAAALILLVALHYFRKRSVPEAAEAQPQEPEPDLSLQITDARTRMARKLLEQGWTAREISRELKLSVKEVGQIISQNQAGADADKS